MLKLLEMKASLGTGILDALRWEFGWVLHLHFQGLVWFRNWRDVDNWVIVASDWRLSWSWDILLHLMAFANFCLEETQLGFGVI